MRRIFLFLPFVCGVLCCRADKSLGARAPELFDQGMNALTGTGPSRSDAQAFDYFRRSAELGFAPAQVVLGYLYDTGHIAALTHTQAAEWYEKAARQDDPLGEWLLGQVIYNGQTSVRDLNEATHWLEKSAAHSTPFAEYLLGLITLERGDYGKAAAWFRKAGTQGLPQAQQQLGSLLKQGRGVNEDKLLRCHASVPGIEADQQPNISRVKPENLRDPSRERRYPEDAQDGMASSICSISALSRSTAILAVNFPALHRV